MTRLDPVRNRQFDVVVIGGGVIGAGAARDAALRGFSVALFEKADFGGGTTSGSTRLIHGGLRYLEMFDFGLVRMDLRERETLLRIAPHLVKPLEFLIPFYNNSLFYRWKLHAGMVLYDLLSYDKSLPRYRTLDAGEVAAAEPNLRREGLQGGVTYFDAQIESPERLTVENAVDCTKAGGVALNYVEVTGGLSDGRAVTGVRIRDTVSGETVEVRARVVINASGPWFNRVAPNVSSRPAAKVRTTKGVHLVCQPLTQRAVVLFSSVDNRLFFFIPQFDYGWISTTDTDFQDDPAKVQATPEDVKYLVESSATYIPEVAHSPMYWTNAGVRALVMQGGKESDVSRSHKIEPSPGLVSILGGKITGYRAIAEEAVDAAAKQLGSAARSTTAERLLPGAARKGVAEPLEESVNRAVREEFCLHVTDFLLRRSTIGLQADQGVDRAPEVARYLAEALGWTDNEREAELRAYREWILRTREPVAALRQPSSAPI